ncbi:MAG: universal stress protein [Candidatus Rokubacteria bacterium]|nr:universal stress protein [Candidatus Rokubacteria bacterium]
MRTHGPWRVLVASDGSPEARAGLQATVAFPWPRRTRASAVVARGAAPARPPAAVALAVDRAFARVVSEARRILGRRWPRAEARLTDRWPVEGILAEARRLGARVVVVAPNGRGPLGRLLLGSVSRDVVRRAPGAVLVVKGRPRRPRRLVLGFDASPHARRAVELVARLVPPARGGVTLVRVVPLERRPPMPSHLPPAARVIVESRMAMVGAERLRAARPAAEAAARRLAQRAWRVRVLVRLGTPLAELLRVAATERADLLVVGARGVGRLRGLVVGSVADGVLNRAGVSVLLVR